MTWGWRSRTCQATSATRAPTGPKVLPLCFPHPAIHRHVPLLFSALYSEQPDLINIELLKLREIITRPHPAAATYMHDYHLINNDIGCK